MLLGSPPETSTKETVVYRTLLLLLLLLLGPLPKAALATVVHLLPYEGAITPVASEYLVEGIETASASGAEAVVIQLDTPGGLDTAMRTIIKSIMASRIPVIVYVAPRGSRAASAGAYITMAAHIAAMAPSTNIGSASPVAMMGAQMDSTMHRKVMHDAIAYLESIADERGRNRELARAFIVDAANITAEEAVEKNVIDLLAGDVNELLEQVDGRIVELSSGSHTLATAGADVEPRPMGLRLSILKHLADPNVAYILLLIGIYGIFFELSNPGALAPGILGGICLLLGLFAMQNLPTNYAGIALLLLGMVLLILEVKVTSYGALTLGGLTALTLGSLMLFDAPGEWARLSLKVLIPGLAGFSLFFILCAWLVVRSHRRPVSTGIEALVGERGRAVGDIASSTMGKVYFHGEIWDAIAESQLATGDRIEVVSIDGRVARVRRVAPDST
jgi:membrane-bound serine protease (ClpP class)